MFLCSEHKKALTQQPYAELESLCDNWLSQAVQHYQQQRWSFALPYAGCAMEVCWMQMQEQSDARLIVKALCLAVYCNNILQHMFELEQGQAVLEMNWQQLKTQNKQMGEHQALLDSCFTLSHNSSGHDKLIQEYTNWPYEPSLTMPRTLH